MNPINVTDKKLKHELKRVLEEMYPTESIDVNQIRHLLNEVKSYKSIIESLNKQIDSFREMEQSYENRIIELGDTKINLQKQLDDLDMEYQALGTKYDSLMQMSVLPMEA